MRGALVIALCATGCFSDRGVAIEVDVGDTGATSVELFIGKEACNPETAPAGVRCGGIAPMGITTLLPGDVWFRDALAEDKAQRKGQTVTFQLKSDKPVTLRRVIAVGFDQAMQPIATATLQDLEIPTNSARVATTKLFHANPVQLKQADTEDRVMVWSNAMSPTSCVVVEHWQHGQANRDFVVPTEDPDCDGVLNNTECNANAYMSMNAGGQAPTPDCFGKGPSETCLLGSLACTDGVGPMPDTCLPQSPQHDQGPVCVPSQFCKSNCTSLDPMCPLDLIKDLTLQVPRIDCHVPVGLDGAPCPGNNSAPISLDTVYGTNARCDQQPLLGALQFMAPPTSSAHTFDGAAMELGSPNAPCNFVITWKSGTRTQPGPLDDHGIIQLQTGERSALLPIVFHFEANGSCPSLPFLCGTAGSTSSSDPLWTCARGQ